MLEQLRAIDLSIVEERVRVAIGRDNPRALPDELADLGPGASARYVERSTSSR
jgi:hypothetical protein